MEPINSARLMAGAGMAGATVGVSNDHQTRADPPRPAQVFHNSAYSTVLNPPFAPLPAMQIASTETASAQDTMPRAEDGVLGFLPPPASYPPNCLDLTVQALLNQQNYAAELAQRQRFYIFELEHASLNQRDNWLSV